ncbi:MAG: pyocin activator PrtN family protein [Tepidimonas ignava]|uniref:pyocin activator PrtN family protein n=2 Tax=Tepidimonas TaxID=114248 RepID=UPI00391DA276
MRNKYLNFCAILLWLKKQGIGGLDLKTLMLLMAQYDAQAVIPVEVVCRDYFQHLTPEKFIRKCASGEIRLPLVRMEGSQKSAKGIHLQDLADYLDARREAAKKELQQLTF